MQWMWDMKKRESGREVEEDNKLFGLRTWKDDVAFN